MGAHQGLISSLRESKCSGSHLLCQWFELGLVEASNLPLSPSLFSFKTPETVGLVKGQGFDPQEKMPEGTEQSTLLICCQFLDKYFTRTLKKNHIENKVLTIIY